MTYVNLLKETTQEKGSIVCVGLDPVLNKIPVEGKDEGEKIAKFYFDLLEGMKGEDEWPAIVKPNIAFYEQYGFIGLQALKKIIPAYQAEGVPVILDAKRGDIGKTSAAYAKAVFDFWGADAVTIAPYMGTDSVSPFIDYCEKGKGVYILNRTSNKGAVDFQNLEVDGVPLYRKVMDKIVEWNGEEGGVGAVVGATYPGELEEISAGCVASGKQIPFLIPGVGAQGGSAQEVVARLEKTGNPLWLHRINSSSGINYAYLKQDTDDYAGAAVKALAELNQEIGFKA